MKAFEKYRVSMLFDALEEFVTRWNDIIAGVSGTGQVERREVLERVARWTVPFYEVCRRQMSESEFTFKY